jgi:hypothetical protein
VTEKKVAEVSFTYGPGAAHPDDGVILEALEVGEKALLAFDLTIVGPVCAQVVGNEITLRLTPEEVAAVRFVIDRVEDKLRGHRGATTN